MASSGARKGIFYGWWIVLIGLLVNAVPAGLYFIGFAVLFLPITRDLGMSRAAASLPLSLTRGISAVQSPFIGIVIDRFGPGRVLFFCSLFAGLGFILLSRVEVVPYLFSGGAAGAFPANHGRLRLHVHHGNLPLVHTQARDGACHHGPRLLHWRGVDSAASLACQRRLRMADDAAWSGPADVGALPAPQYAHVQLPGGAGAAARRGPTAGRGKSRRIAPSVSTGEAAPSHTRG